MTPALTPEHSQDSGSGQPGSTRSPAAARWTFVALAAALLPIMVLSSFDFGVTWDELSRHQYGERVWQFLRGLRSRSSFAETGGHVYPGMFDTMCAALETWLPGDRYVLRHAVNAVFGWVGVVYCGRLAGRLFGPWAGVLALVLLAASPRYFADSMNNPKDLPFAATTVMALYYMSGVSARWPYVSGSTAVTIVLSLALALGTRAGALLYLGYFCVLVAALVVLERNWNARRLADTAGRVLAIVVATLFLGTVFWPWAGGAPLTRPFEALLYAANFPWDGEVLFRGQAYLATDLPWYYALWWFVIATPLVVLAGVALSVVSFSGREDAWRRIALWTIVVFPVASTIVRRSTLYDGIRHLEFIYPLLVLLAASGWAGVLRASRPWWLRQGAAAYLAVGVASLVVFDIRFHPNQGVFFNALVGGPRGAFTHYDMDYWGNCVLQAVEWTADTARRSRTPIRVSGSPSHLVQLNAKRFPEIDFSYPGRDRQHLDIELARGPVLMLRRLARRPALHHVRTPDGAVLCAVIPGPAFDEQKAFRRPAAPWDMNHQADHQ